MGTKKEVTKDAEIVLDFLNKKAKKHFRPVAGSLTHIKNRLREGFSIEELTKVVSYKNDIDTFFFKENRHLLNPATLFRPCHFADYLGQAETYEQEGE